MLDMCLINVIVYLYGLFDSDIYIKIFEGLKETKINYVCPKTTFSIKLRISLYGSKLIFVGRGE